MRGRTPGRGLAVMHGGKQTHGAYGEESDNIDLVVKPELPRRLNCGCQGGNGGTPFLFMQWLANSVGRWCAQICLVVENKTGDSHV